MKIIAYCWATGLIEFATELPPEAIEIARGDASLVRDLIARTSRLGHRNEPLVPGVPESTDQASKGDALGAWLLWLKGREAPGLTVAVSDGATYNPFYAGSFTGSSCFTLNADDRIRLIKTFNVHQLRAAQRVRGLQKTVCAAIERRLRALEREAEA